jgi:hypothetical protein
VSLLTAEERLRKYDLYIAIGVGIIEAVTIDRLPHYRLNPELFDRAAAELAQQASGAASV